MAPQAAETQESTSDEPTRTDTFELDKIRNEAEEILLQARYRGRLTELMLRQLEPLINTHIPEEYLHFSKKTEGKPYDSTGIRSLQVQVDLANAVLGAAHWRLLCHYPMKGNTPDPLTCHAWIVVGNKLQHVKLLDDGETIDPAAADVLLARDGWGGVKRANHDGDGRKGSQTNATKRAMAQVGFGANVYRLDFDEELIDGMAPAGAPAAVGGRAKPRTADTGRAASPAAAQQTPVQALTMLVGKDDELRELRERANTGMELCGMAPEKRLHWFTEAGGTREELEALIERAERALEAKDTEAETPTT